MPPWSYFMHAKRVIDEHNSEHFSGQYDAVSISTSILFLLSIGIDDTFEAVSVSNIGNAFEKIVNNSGRQFVKRVVDINGH